MRLLLVISSMTLLVIGCSSPAPPASCAVANGGCAVGATCADVAGGTRCACQAGQAGDGRSCRDAWLQVASFADADPNPDGFGAKAAAVGTRIYFGPEVGDPAKSFFRWFDTGTLELSVPLALPLADPSTDFCACGYTDTFTSDGAGIYMLGNEGYRYDPANGAWSAVAGYSRTVTPETTRGEAAASFDASNQVLLLVGGRGTETSVERLDVATGAFSVEEGILPVRMSSARAYTPPGGSLTYVAGGDYAFSRALLTHQTGSGTWSRLLDAPASLERPTGMGGFEGRIWVATRTELLFYDPVAGTWAAEVVKGPAGMVLAVEASGGTYALVKAGTTLEVHRLVHAR